MSKAKPLTAKEVKRIATNLGFRHRNTEGGHENWVRESPPPFRKITIDTHLEPFKGDLVMYMARQAGLTTKQFYQALDED